MQKMLINSRHITLYHEASMITVSSGLTPSVPGYRQMVSYCPRNCHHCCKSGIAWCSWDLKRSLLGEMWHVSGLLHVPRSPPLFRRKFPEDITYHSCRLADTAGSSAVHPKTGLGKSDVPCWNTDTQCLGHNQPSRNSPLCGISHPPAVTLPLLFNRSQCRQCVCQTDTVKLQPCLCIHGLR